jgi:integrase
MCELTRRRWSDFDFERGRITLVRSKVGNTDILDLHPALRTALVRLRMRRTKTELHDHVILSKRGTAFTNVTKSWAVAVKGAGLEGRDGLTFHSLRHSFATHFFEGGGAVMDLQAQLGHAALATTQICAASVSERRRAAVMGLDFGAGRRSARRPVKRSAKKGA